MELANRKVVPLLRVMQPTAPRSGEKGCGSKGDHGKPSCGSAAGQAYLAPEVWEKVKNHPCYSEEALHHFARMHVAVAPACNMQCNYCNRKYDCSNESRPGVVSERLTPEQAARKVLAVASAIPQMTVKGLQDSCEGEMNMMRHCRQCRADAVGLLGEDRSAEFTAERVMEMEVNYDLQRRQAYQQTVELQRDAVVAARNAELKTLAGKHSNISILIAVATKGGGRINEHFGHAKEFQVYEVSTEGPRFVGHRRVDNYCQGGYAEEDSLETVVRAINDCTAVFVARIGGCPRKGLAAAGIEPVDRFALEFVEQSAIAYFREYLERVGSGEIEHRQRGDAEIRQGALIA